MSDSAKIVNLSAKSTGPLSMTGLFRETMKRNASDLHLNAGMPPAFRIKGQLHPMDCDPCTPEEIKDMLYSILTPRHKDVLEKKKSVDLALSINDVGRFRVAAYHQKGAISVAFRLLMNGIPTFSSLNLPDSLSRLSKFRDGLVLVTGVTGSGKSTTLATVIDDINSTSRLNIITY